MQKIDWKASGDAAKITAIRQAVETGSLSREIARDVFENCTADAVRKFCSARKIKLLDGRKASAVAAKKPARTASRLVRRMFDIIDEGGKSYGQHSNRMGVHSVTLCNWKRRGASPRLFDFECAIEALGYRLEIVPAREAAK